MSPSPMARRTGGARLLAFTAVAGASAWALLPASSAFVASGAAAPPRSLRGGARVARAAEAEAKSSVALVRVTEESKATTASVLGGLAGLLVGGVWVGGAVFAASAYLAKKEEDDVSKALKGVAAGGLEVLNFGAYLNDKYAVSDKIGSALSEAVNSAQASGAKEGAQASKDESSFISQAAKAIQDADKEVGFKETFGTIATSATDLAFQAVEKAVELNDKYKVTDQIVEKVTEAANSASAKSASSSK